MIVSDGFTESRKQKCLSQVYMYQGVTVLHFYINSFRPKNLLFKLVKTENI